MIVEGIHIGAIYKHFKGDLYRVQEVAFNHHTLKGIVIYYACDENGVFKSLRGKDIIVPQPFYRDVGDFLENIQGMYPNNSIPIRFQLFK